MKKILAAKYKRFIFTIEILFALLLLPLAYNFVPINNGSKVFYIPSSDVDYIIQTLNTNGYEVTAIDRWMLTFKELPKEGWYSIEPSHYSRFSFFMNLYQQKTDKTMDLVIFAGETKEELTSRIANDIKLDQKKLLDIYKSLAYFEEADILAQRYTIARKADEHATMKYIFLDSRRKLNTFSQNYFKRTPKLLELKVIYTLASVIQKESNSASEMPFISSVIYNRLKKNMKLQMDGTLNYGKYAHTIVTPERIKNDESAYNTYKHKGLPPHPLSTVTIDALIASIKPAKSDYLFFMLDKNGNHNFSATYENHLANVRAFRIYQKEKKKKKEKDDAITPMQFIPLADKSLPNTKDINVDWKKVSL